MNETPEPDPTLFDRLAVGENADEEEEWSPEDEPPAADEGLQDPTLPGRADQE